MRPWLHRIAINRAIDWSRARALRNEVGADAAGEAAAPAGGPSSVFGEDVAAALMALGPERRAVVVLRYLLDMTPGEIAQILGLPRGHGQLATAARTGCARRRDGRRAAMNERELRQALQNAAREDAGVRRRSWRVVQAAYASSDPRRRRRSRRRAALVVVAALVPAAAVGGAAASVPDSGVGRWVRSVFDARERRAQPALVRVPGGGRLLVEAGGSAWVVASDGGKRRLGAYSGASWSPHARFVIAWRGRELTALDPRGRVRWSLARSKPVSSARWGPVDGYRIAYLAGRELRIVNGDGTGDHRYAAARGDVAPAWRPDGAHVLGYIDGSERVNVVAVDSRRRLWRSARVAGARLLGWSPDGRRLLAVARRRLVLFDGSGRRLISRDLPAGSAVRDAAWAPRGDQVAVVRHSGTMGRSEVVLLNPARRLRERVLFTGPGHFGGLAWSPSGARLLVAWRDADQWLFLRPRGGGRLATVANIASQFMPGATSRVFPRSVQWCCRVPARRGPGRRGAQRLP